MFTQTGMLLKPQRPVVRVLNLPTRIIPDCVAAFSSGSSSSRKIVAAAETEIVVAAAETV